MTKGELYYSEKIDDIIKLVDIIKNNKRELIDSQTETECIPDLKREIYLLEKELLEQQLKEKLYIELKNILAKQSGPEVTEKLVIYQQNLKERGKQLKDMVGELKSYQSQVHALMFEIERIDKQIGVTKEHYFDMR